MFNKEVYKRYTSNKFSRKDYLLTRDAFSDSNNVEQLNNFLENDWDEINQQPIKVEKNLNHLLHKIHYSINKNKERKNKRGLSTVINYYSRATAILFIPVLLAISFFQFNNYQENKLHQSLSYTEIHAPLGTRTEFQLPDGSTGWLNSGSILKYTLPFINNRELKLTGEAYFDVKHIKDESFKVNFSDLTVNVLGTRFNIMAYENEQTAEVILEHGKVEILNQQKKLISELSPDRKFTLNKTSNSAVIEKVNATNYTMWKAGKLVFRNEPLPEVIKRLSRWYNVDFELADDRLLKINYRATFVDEQLPEVLRLLSLSAPISYKIEERTMDANHEFLKRKVILTYSKTN